MNKTSLDLIPSLYSSQFQNSLFSNHNSSLNSLKNIPDPLYRYYSESDWNLLTSRTYPNPISGYILEDKGPSTPVTAKSISNKFWDKEDLLRDRLYSIRDKIRDERSLARKARNKTLDFEDDLKKAKLDAEKETLRIEKENYEKNKKEIHLQFILNEAKKRSHKGLAYDYIEGKTEDITSNLKLIQDYAENLKKIKQTNLDSPIVYQGYTSHSYLRPCTSLVESSRQNSNFHKSIEYLSCKLEGIQRKNNIF